jgi:hypothetical protein
MGDRHGPESVIGLLRNQRSASTGTRILEGYLHRRNALNRIDREWFILSDAEVARAVDDAEEVNRWIDADVARRARDTAQAISNGQFRRVGPDQPENAEVLLHFAEVPALVARQVELEAAQMDIGAELSIATGTYGGIVGVAKWEEEPPKLNRFRRRLQMEAGADAARYERAPDATFAFLLRSEAPRRLEAKIGPRRLANEPPRPRDDAAEDAHRRYLRADAELAAVEAQLGVKELILRASLGGDEGFEGVCGYVRKPAVDWEKVQRDDPGLFERCTGGRRGSMRFTVIPFRSYL